MSSGAASVTARRGLMVALAAGLFAPGCEDPEMENPTPRFLETPVEYPVRQWEQDVEGSTLVRVLVNEEGGVDSVMIAESSGVEALDLAALRGAWTMDFEPARRNGEPIKVWARIPVHFSKFGENPGDPVSGTANPPAASGSENPPSTEGRE